MCPDVVLYPRTLVLLIHGLRLKKSFLYLQVLKSAQIHIQSGVYSGMVFKSKERNHIVLQVEA